MEKYAFFDVDRTIRKGSAAFDFCNWLVGRGLVDGAFKEKDAAVRAAYKEGRIDYQGMVGGVVTIHGTVIGGLRVNQLEEEYERYVHETKAFFDWTEELFKLLKDNNVKTVLVSAGIRPAIEAIGKHLGVDHIFTSQPEIKNGRYTGNVTRILHDVDKNELVSEFISNLGGEYTKIGFGDSTGDVLMLQLMDAAIIYDPHQEEMVQIAQQHNWPVVRNKQEMLSRVKVLLKND